MTLRRAASLTSPSGLALPDGHEFRVLVDRAGRPVSLRAAAEGEGTFDGYGCVWNVRDAYGTMFAPGCFSRGGLDTELYALLWMHMSWQPVGVFTAEEDDYGLRIAGRWDDDDDGQAARSKAKSGSAPGLSVGFVPMAVDPDDESVFTQARLVEVSQITARMAAVPGAGLVGVRSGQREQQQLDAEAAAQRAAAILALSEPVRD